MTIQLFYLFMALRTFYCEILVDHVPSGYFCATKDVSQRWPAPWMLLYGSIVLENVSS